MTVFHPQWRETALTALDETFDLVVVGAGITGSGIALDAAQPGLATLLVERGDVGAGTSSRSSKLIHGGLRYLKQMQFRVTRLACRERDRMLGLSPHLVHPIRFLYPAYHGDRTPGWQIDVGLWMYDRLTGRPDRHAQLEDRELQALAPGLALSELDRALIYSDAMADDARLTLAVAATAHHYGAQLLTRCEVTGAERPAGGAVAGVTLHDLTDGRSHRVRARVVINATGAWTDALRDRLGLAGTRVRPSRGSHLIIPSSRLPIEVAVTLLAPDDGRPVFLIPHPEGVLVGTTDHYHKGELDDPRPTAAEVDYLLRAAMAAFPDRRLGRADIRGAFAGLRPILDTHADDPSEATREEEIWEEEGALTVAGGKLTTWRSTAEEAVDEALKLLPEERARRAAPCATAGTPLAGLAPPDLGERLTAVFEIEPDVARGMARRLGAIAWTAAATATRRAELRRLTPDTDLCPAEVRAHLRWGAVIHLEDLLLRRVRVGMWDPEQAVALLRPLRPILRTELGWEWRRWKNEEAGFLRALEGWTLAGIRAPSHPGERI
ncbi:MAG TPA: glycerol-3-phosphate dehydrogenase/oxidase [Thermoanaerobaculales bacterium]|nr:glycerol-3-phosphate dehydrogenase/oxidase [Thermoanaerobaculales bacterium]